MNETDKCCGIDTEWQCRGSPLVRNRKMDDIPSKSLSTEFHPITATKNEDCREGKYRNHSFLLPLLFPLDARLWGVAWLFIMQDVSLPPSPLWISSFRPQRLPGETLHTFTPSHICPCGISEENRAFIFFFYHQETSITSTCGILSHLRPSCWEGRMCSRPQSRHARAAPSSWNRNSM